MGPKEKSNLADQLTIHEANWWKLFHAFIAGSGKFPQNLFAQGITGAHAMADLARQGVSWESLSTAQPSPEFFQRIDQARIKGHAAQGFETKPRPVQSVENLWLEGRQQSLRFLSFLANQQYFREHGFYSPLRPSQLLETVFADPEKYLVAEMEQLLQTALNALNSPEVQALALEYRSIITIFMQKYSHPNLIGIPDTYFEDSRILHQELRRILTQAVKIVKNSCAQQSSSQFKQCFLTYPNDIIFGDLSVASIDPLRVVVED